MEVCYYTCASLSHHHHYKDSSAQWNHGSCSAEDPELPTVACDDCCLPQDRLNWPTFPQRCLPWQPALLWFYWSQVTNIKVTLLKKHHCLKNSKEKSYLSYLQLKIQALKATLLIFLYAEEKSSSVSMATHTRSAWLCSSLSYSTAPTTKRSWKTQQEQANWSTSPSH